MSGSSWKEKCYPITHYPLPITHYPLPITASIELDSDGLHDLVPLRELAFHERAHLLRRHGDGVRALVEEPGFHVGGGIDLAELCIDSIDDLARRPGRSEKAEPGAGFVAGHAGFGDGRNLRRGGAALRAADRDGAEPSRVDLRQHRQRVGEHRLHLARHEIGYGLRRSLVRDVHQIYASL